MDEDQKKLNGPDLEQGVDLSMIPDTGMLLGHARGEPVMLVRRGDELFAIGSICTHYGAPLETGLLVGDTVRCPWHHACFSLRTGEDLRAPARDPVSCWRVERVRDAARQFTPAQTPVETVYVREKLERVVPHACAVTADTPKSVVIVGGGAAGNATAETLRREGYQGRITMLSAGASLPCDRPNLSKGYLAGTATEASNLLRPAKFYQDNNIDLQLKTRVTSIDVAKREVQVEGGASHAYEALVLATGAEPVHLDVPGAELPHVHYLRTLTDSQTLVAAALKSKRAVIIGASFIGLEVASSLRARNLDVHVVGIETIPMEKVLGPQVGEFIRRMHEQHGVTFHLGTTAVSIDEQGVTLKTGETLPADLVVIGIGVRPAMSLAVQAGLHIDRGVAVNEYLETSIPSIYAAGDIARWPDLHTGEMIRVEHFVVAERQGQTVARNILGLRELFDAAPFFWTEQYDLGVAYVGHAEHWNDAEIDGDLEARKCSIIYRRDGKKLAQAMIHRDLEGLRVEVAFERAMAGERKEIFSSDGADARSRRPAATQQHHAG